MTRRPLSDWLILLALVVLWGSSFALVKVALGGASPLTLAALRLCVGAAALLALARLRGDALPVDRRSLGWMAWLGLTGSGIPAILIAFGQRHIDSGLAGILIATTPLITAALAHRLIPGDRLTARRALGLAIGFAGTAVLFAPAVRLDGAADLAFLLGAGATLGATLGYALRGVTAALAPPMGAIPRAAGALAAGAAFALPLALVVDGIPRVGTPSALAAIVALGLGANALAEVLVFRLVARAGPSFMTLSNYLIPLWAVGLGAVLFAERPPLAALAALALVLAGIYVAERARRGP